jgi:hypothetical protein
MATLLADMAQKMSVRTPVENELEEVKRDVAPDAVRGWLTVIAFGVATTTIVAILLWPVAKLSIGP